MKLVLAHSLPTLHPIPDTVCIMGNNGFYTLEGLIYNANITIDRWNGAIQRPLMDLTSNTHEPNFWVGRVRI